MKHRRQLLWFLWGLGGQLQLFGTSLCFTEVFVYLAAPLLFSREWPYMKRNGVSTFFWLAIALMINAALSCVYNHTPMHGVIRGMAVVCLFPCAIVVSHWMLRKDMANFKWAVVGGCLSGFLSTFIFRKSAEVLMLAKDVSGSAASDAIMNGPLWWISRVGSLVMTVPTGWYIHVPTWFAATLSMGLAAFALFTSVSGRSAALGSLGSAILVLLGGKNPSQIRRRVCRHFWMICIAGVIAVLTFKTFYKKAVVCGWLGEEARTKYEKQTSEGESIKALLLGGRMESFCGLTACVEQPIIGFGPWAFDTNGYTARFLAKYGNPDDYDALERNYRANPSAVHLIPCHSHITMSWLWYGIAGLIFWIYVLFACVRFLRQDCYAVPQLYMWLAAGMPGFFWNVFFSAIAARIGPMMFVVALLMVRSVRKGIQPLPYAMIEEIRRIEAR